MNRSQSAGETGGRGLTGGQNVDPIRREGGNGLKKKGGTRMEQRHEGLGCREEDYF